MRRRGPTSKLLDFLRRERRPISYQEARRILNFSPKTLYRAIKNLETKGVVETVTSLHDTRQKVIILVDGSDDDGGDHR